MLLYWHKYAFSENWTNGKVEVMICRFVKVLILNQVFHNKLLNVLQAFIFNFLFPQSTFSLYSIYANIFVSKIIKQTYQICNKYIRNYSSKMKELNQIFIQKGHLNNPEGQVEVEYPPNRKLILISFSYIKKNIFFSKGHF